jgi:hypothetical protein
VSVPSRFAIPQPTLAGFRARLRLGANVTHILMAVALAPLANAQIDTTSVVPNRYLIVYRNAAIPADAAARVSSAGALLLQRNEHFGIAAVQSTAVSQDDATTIRRLAAQPNVAYVLHDRIVSSHRLQTRAVAPATLSIAITPTPPTNSTSIGKLPTHGPPSLVPPPAQQHPRRPRHHRL